MIALPKGGELVRKAAVCRLDRQPKIKIKCEKWLILIFRVLLFARFFLSLSLSLYCFAHLLNSIIKIAKLSTLKFFMAANGIFCASYFPLAIFLQSINSYWNDKDTRSFYRYIVFSAILLLTRLQTKNDFLGVEERMKWTTEWIPFGQIQN